LLKKAKRPDFSGLFEGDRPLWLSLSNPPFQILNKSMPQNLEISRAEVCFFESAFIKESPTRADKLRPISIFKK